MTNHTLAKQSRYDSLESITKRSTELSIFNLALNGFFKRSFIWSL